MLKAWAKRWILYRCESIHSCICCLKSTTSDIGQEMLMIDMSNKVSMWVAFFCLVSVVHIYLSIEIQFLGCWLLKYQVESTAPAFTLLVLLYQFPDFDIGRHIWGHRRALSSDFGLPRLSILIKIFKPKSFIQNTRTPSQWY